MTTLTEQMKQGTLPNGNYWVMFNGDVTQMENYNGWFLNCEVPVEYEKIDEVLCECLTYEETIAMKDCARMLWAAAEREVKLKKLLKECELWFTGIVGNMNDKNVGEHNRNIPIGNFEYIFKVFSQKINQVLGEE